MKKLHKFQLIRSLKKTNRTISQTTDSGRSMVEMLGVLAVIGVLSITSILGYRYAMAKWRANETVDELNIRAHDIAFRFDNLSQEHYEEGKEIEMEMGDTTRLGYPIMARISPQYEDYFEIFVSNVPTDVCKELLKSQWQAPYSIFVGVEEYEASSDICEQAENVQLAYEFYKDLSNKEEVPEETRHEIQRCYHDNHCKCGTCNADHGLCEGYCTTEQVCKKDFDDPRWLVCCKPEFVVGDYCCGSVTADGKCCSRDGKACCPLSAPMYTSDGKCYGCNNTSALILNNPQSCSIVCPNRVLNNSYDKRCVLCGSPGTSVANKPIPNRDGNCYSCTDISSIQMVNSWDTTARNEAKAICESVCDPGTRKWNGSLNCEYAGECPANKPLRATDGNCYACNYAYGLQLRDPDSCTTKCPKRYLNNSADKRCSLCGVEGTDVANKPIPNRDGNCYSCTDISSIQMVNSWDTTARNEAKAICESVCDPGTRKWNGSLNCEYAGECPANKPLRATDGNCYACNYAYGLQLRDPDSCTTKCPKRYQNNSADKRCSLCGVEETDVANKPIPNRDGNCYSCTDISSIQMVNSWDTTARNEAKAICESVCDPGTRKWNGSLNCEYAGDCPANKPLRATDGNCYACDYIYGLQLKDPDSCTTKCPKRYQNNSADKRCSLCGVEGTDVVNKPIPNRDGNCYSCTDISSIQMVNSWDNTARSEAAKICENSCASGVRTWNGSLNCEYVGECPADKPLRATDGNCYACNYAYGLQLRDPDSCTTKCPKRYQNNSADKRCSLCGVEGTDVANKPIPNRDGNCYSCTDISSIQMVNSWDTTARNEAKAICENSCASGVRTWNGSLNCEYVGDCPADKPLRATDGNCYACNYAYGLQLRDPDSCTTKCPKRYLNNSADKRCSLCGVEGTDVANKPIPNRDGSCYSCTDSSSIQMVNSWDTTARNEAKAICESVCDAGTRKWNGSLNCEYMGECPADKPLRATDGNCYACDYTYGLQLRDPSSCSTKCPKRYLNNSVDKRCSLCGATGTDVANKPIPNKDGSCYSCTDSSSIQMVTSWDTTARNEAKAICESVCIAGTRKWNGINCERVSECPSTAPLKAADGSCHACNEESAIVVEDSAACSVCAGRFLNNETEKKCLICGGSGTDFESKPLWNSSGKCFACNEPNAINAGSVAATKTMCDNCSDSREMAGQFCILKKVNVCPEEKPLLSRNGTCYTCDEKLPINVADYADCLSACPKRSINNSTDMKCVLCGVAGTDYEEKPLIDVNGNCYSCETGTNVNVGTGECDSICPNRTDEGGICKRTSCPIGKFEASDGICYKCNITTEMRVKEDEECTKSCTNRIMQAGMCVLK